jgi:hypothetical protein
LVASVFTTLIPVGGSPWDIMQSWSISPECTFSGFLMFTTDCRCPALRNAADKQGGFRQSSTNFEMSRSIRAGSCSTNRRLMNSPTSGVPTGSGKSKGQPNIAAMTALQIRHRDRNRVLRSYTPSFRQSLMNHTVIGGVRAGKG